MFVEAIDHCPSQEAGVAEAHKSAPEAAQWYPGYGRQQQAAKEFGDVFHWLNDNFLTGFYNPGAKVSTGCLRRGGPLGRPYLEPMFVPCPPERVVLSLADAY